MYYCFITAYTSSLVIITPEDKQEKIRNNKEVKLITDSAIWVGHTQAFYTI